MGAERGGSASSPKERDKRDILSPAVREETIFSLKKKKKRGKVDLTHSNLHISQLVNEVFHYPAKDEAGKARREDGVRWGGDALQSDIFIFC